MDARKKSIVTATALIAASLALLVLAVWLLLAHRPPMPGPPPGGPAPEGFVPAGPPPAGRPPMVLEVKVALIGLMAVLMTLCVVFAFRLLRRRPAASPADVPDSIRFKADYKTVTVPLAHIRYIESMSEYVKIFLEGQTDPLIVLYSLKRLEQELPSSRFIRIHRSYIVALDRVRKSSATSVVLDGDITLPIGASYRAAFRSYFPAR